MICAACGAEKTLPKERLPSGWKRLGDDVFCRECWRKQYVLRAVTIPIAGPVCTEKPGAKEAQPLEWPEFRTRLRTSWIATTAAANFIIREMAKLDPGLSAPGVSGKQKLGAMPKCYFYPEIRQRWPELATCSVVSLDKAVQAKYRATRFDQALGRISLPSFRYPVPIPIHNGTWSVWEDDGGRLLLSFLLAGGGRITVRLRGGQGFRRQLGMVRQIIRGEAVQGELAVYRVGASPGDNRNGDTPQTRVMAKMVAWLPRNRMAHEEESVATLHTGGDAFLTLYDAGEHAIFRWNRDDLRRRIRAHDEQMQRLREDAKAERGLRRDRDGLFARMELLARHQNHWLHTVCHQTAKEVVGMLKRRRVTHLLYVGRDQSYLDHFPWHKLKELLAEKCEAAGITFASGDVEEKTA